MQHNIAPAPRQPRRGDRTFTGCWTCRKRKVKCDQAIPHCSSCLKVGRPCEGYNSKLVWVTSDNKTYKSHGRRFLRCDLTWSQVPTFDSDQLDYLIALCDAAERVPNTSIEWSHETHIPFSAFPIGESMGAKLRRMPRSLIHGQPLKDEEAFLFRHYVVHVSGIMMPYDDKRNPWRSHYPAVAIHNASGEERVLYKALLAHAALNLAHLGCATERLLLLGARYYTEAMAELRGCIAKSMGDYASSIAAILTLMFVEIYAGHSHTWRAHYKGAWGVLETQQAESPWTSSDFAWASTQSLCLIKIIGDTSKLCTSDVPEPQLQYPDTDQDILVKSIASEVSFGFTIGATSVLMTCIADIKRLAAKVKLANSISLDDEVEDLCLRLEEWKQADLGNIGLDIHQVTTAGLRQVAHATAAQYHLNAFIAATYIYMYRTVFHLPPASLQRYVREVFKNIRQFYEISGGNFSLWPAFIAAVEAYEDEDIGSAKTWLQSATSVGMANRFKIKMIIEEVWHRRAEGSEAFGQHIGNIAVDWREVMHELDIDVLLV